MQHNRFIIKAISEENLNSFFKEYKPNFDYQHIEDIFKMTLELAYSNDTTNFTNVIHACFDTKLQKYCAILNLGTTTDIDNIVSIHIEFAFIEAEYRKIHFSEIDSTLLEFLLLDYVVGNICLNTKTNIGISTVALTPINEKVRNRYEQIGFESIRHSGSNKYEDWMIFSI